MTVYGYVRVSTKDQETNFSIENQTEELLAKDIKPENLYVEIGSASGNQPVLQKLIDNLAAGDTLIVTRLDRFCRNVQQALATAEKIQIKGAIFISLDVVQSNSRSTNNFTFQMLAAIAEFETSRRKERQQEGIKKAQLAGLYRGRNRIITPAIEARIFDLLSRNLTVTELCKVLSISKSTFYRHFERLDSTYKKKT